MQSFEIKNKRYLYYYTHSMPGVLSYVIAAVFVLLFGMPLPSYAKDPGFLLPKRSELLKLQTAQIITSKGSLLFTLFPKEAPWHVANFKYLADKKFYQGLPFHLFRKGYIIQGGEPSGKLNGPGYSLPPEFSRRKHVRGTLGMARRADFMNSERRSNGSQFHVLLRKAPHMDGSYTIFGELISGDDVLAKLRQGDVITDVIVYVRPTNE